MNDPRPVVPFWRWLGFGALIYAAFAVCIAASVFLAVFAWQEWLS